MESIDTLLTDHLDLWASAIVRKSSAGRGRSKKFSLHGIDKLRALILDLAVRGKLVPQDPNDDSATALLKSLGFEAKTGLVSCPQGWAMAPLTAFGEFHGGITPSKGKKSYWGPGLPWVSPKDMGGERIQETEDEITELALQETSLKEIPPGSLLMVARSGILRRKFPVAINEMSCTTNQDMKSLVLKPGVKPRYLQIMLIGHQPRILQELVKRGMTVESLIFNEFTKALWPIPPLAEQHRIIAKVDELMALCDRLEAGTYEAIEAHQLLVTELLATLTASRDAGELADNWVRIETHFDTLFVTEDSVDQLKHTILQLAVKGKLVPQDSNDEPASELLKRIKAKKAELVTQGKLKQTKPLPQIKDTEKSFDLPKGWEWARLQEVIDVRDGTHDSPKDAVGNDTFPLITSKDFRDGEIDFSSARQISEADHNEISKRSLVEKDDILFSMIGGNIGNQVMVKDDKQFSVKNVALFKYYDRVLTVPSFMKVYTENLAVDLQRRASGGAQPFVALGYLRNLPIAVPSSWEQSRISAKFSELTAICDALKLNIQEGDRYAIQIADAVVAKVVD